MPHLRLYFYKATEPPLECTSMIEPPGVTNYKTPLNASGRVFPFEIQKIKMETDTNESTNHNKTHPVTPRRGHHQPQNPAQSDHMSPPQRERPSLPQFKNQHKRKQLSQPLARSPSLTTRVGYRSHFNQYGTCIST